MTRLVRFALSQLALAAALATTETAISAQDMVLEFDPARTKVEFTLSDVLHTVHGTFLLDRGSLRFAPATGKAEGELVVNAASGASGSGARDKRMQRNVLESERYPEIVFRPDRFDGKLSAEGRSLLQVHGMFTIHGAAHEITLPVEVDASAGRYAASTRFEVPYVKWGMKNPSTLFLRVGDKVDITIRTAAAPHAEKP
jgi:polyisoprenoid-binding protein YceI